jgi:hypothetical protein
MVIPKSSPSSKTKTKTQIITRNEPTTATTLDMEKPYIDKSFSKAQSIPLHIPITCGIYVHEDDALARGNYRESKRLNEVLRAIKKFSDSSLGQYDPMETNLPIVRSVERDCFFRPPPDNRHVLRYLMKLIVTVYIYNGNEDALERARLGVRSALKMALEEGWI